MDSLDIPKGKTSTNLPFSWKITFGQHRRREVLGWGSAHVADDSRWWPPHPATAIPNPREIQVHSPNPSPAQTPTHWLATHVPLSRCKLSSSLDTPFKGDLAEKFHWSDTWCVMTFSVSLGDPCVSGLSDMLTALKGRPLMLTLNIPPPKGPPVSPNSSYHQQAPFFLLSFCCAPWYQPPWKGAATGPLPLRVDSAGWR